jgi:transcriptional regulator with XRE-family HTH domain
MIEPGRASGDPKRRFAKMGNEMPDKLKDVIKKGRQKKKYSQAKLGKLTGVWGTYIGQIEKGVRKPSDEVCKKLAEELDLDLKTLLILTLKERAEISESKELGVDPF